MGTERSDQVYFSYLEASQKFDYFVVGVALALVGYLGANYSPERLGWNPQTVELGAIVSLLLSAIAGLKRIETNVTLLAVMSRRLQSEEAAGALTGAAAGGAPSLNKSTGDILWPHQALAQAQYYKMGAEVISEKLSTIADWSGRWYVVRNVLLILGLALLIVARVGAAYLP